ncbi:MAG: hypothetical protein HKN70_12435 [Gammaproteobacteria bacterium]|nr:hypothetical protein [Gammaproteobacteria bacterium]
MNDLKPETGTWAANITKNTTRLAVWTGAWVLTMALANYGPKFLWNSNEALTIIAVLVNLATGAGMILANKRHLQGLDELHQKIQLEAMALALGVGLVVGLAWSNLDVSDMFSSDAEISHIVILMALTYLGGIVVGHRKYQ